MDKIIDTVLCASIDDETRFRQILEKLIDDGSIEAYSAFTNERKSKATARKRKVRIDFILKYTLHCTHFLHNQHFLELLPLGRSPKGNVNSRQVVLVAQLTVLKKHWKRKLI